MAQFLFLGRLEDVAGVAEMQVPLADMTSLETVMDRFPSALFAALREPKIRIAVNGELVGASRDAGNLMISDGDEVAFLPPVSGG